MLFLLSNYLLMKTKLYTLLFLFFVANTFAINTLSSSKEISVIDLVITTRITDLENIQMPSLMAYPLYASAAVGEGETITNFEFKVDGVILPSTFSLNSYVCFWTPSQFGSFTIEMIAYASGGSSTSLIKIVNVSNTMASVNKQTFENNVINFDGSGESRWFYGTYTLPQFVGVYSAIMANFVVTCPNVTGGCDDWDRLAWVQIKNPNGQWVELFRYITPYGVGCNHSIDVTDYESILQGTIEFRMFIDTWGTGGWNLNLQLAYTQGTPAFNYSSIEEIWQGDYNFGNFDTPQPVPVKTITVPTNTSDMKFRLVTTGHGWGQNNTGNAAEFYNTTHYLKVNNNPTFTQHLWTTCNPNPDNCTGQAGTWQYNRAGWCPGSIPLPYFYDLNSFISAGVFDYKYEFQGFYKDYCNASNPNCVSGTTCPDCNDGYNPFYRIGAYMIYKGNEPLQTLSTQDFSILENKITLYPNPNKGAFKIQIQNEMSDFVVEIFDITGKAIKNYYFPSKSDLDNYSFNLNDIAKGTYFVKVYDTKSNFVSKLIID